MILSCELHAEEPFCYTEVVAVTPLHREGSPNQSYGTVGSELGSDVVSVVWVCRKGFPIEHLGHASRIVLGAPLRASRMKCGSSLAGREDVGRGLYVRHRM